MRSKLGIYQRSHVGQWTSCNHITDTSSDRTEKAYICNYESHWLTLRKFGQEWYPSLKYTANRFNLNSLEETPIHLSDTYLAMYLKQLKIEGSFIHSRGINFLGYSIFVVHGSFPTCEADQMASFLSS